MFKVMCNEGEECWCDERFEHDYQARNYATYLRRLVPGRKVWVECPDGSVYLY